jgi:hypothetical protein
VTFERQQLGRPDDEVVTINGATAVPGEVVVLDTEEEGLGPGESYRWRVRGTAVDAVVPGWSPWCEFTVAADLIDMRDVTDLAAVEELGVVPERPYPVTLTVRQWRLVIDSVAVSLTDGWAANPDGLSEWERESVERSNRTAAGLRKKIAGRAGRARVTVTLTGDQWATVARQVAENAAVWDMTAEEDPQVEEDGAALWTVVDRISAELGGPARPRLEVR